MRLTVSPLVLAVSLGLLNPSALDAELLDEATDRMVSADPVDSSTRAGPEGVASDAARAATRSVEG